MKKQAPNDTDRIIKMLKFMFVVLLIIISGLVAFGVYALRDVKTGNENYVDLKLRNVELTPGKDGLSVRGQQGIQGIQGVQGTQGPKGDDGNDGDTGDVGQSGLQGVQGEKGDKGDSGEKGEQGEPGKIVFVRQNPVTGEEECRYAGDTMWKPAEECAG